MEIIIGFIFGSALLISWAGLIATLIPKSLPHLQLGVLVAPFIIVLLFTLKGY